MVALLALASCHGGFLDAGDCRAALAGGDIATCDVPGWDDRPYDVVVPPDYDGATPLPLVVDLHGGGSDKEGAERSSCSDGDVDDDSCIHRHAQDNGYAIVFPSGTGFGLGRNRRTWNAGGGGEGWRCASGKACEKNIDDVGYIGDLLDDVEERLEVDTARVYATGLSNGGAMSHRLACELSDRITAVAPVGGAMQYTTTAECSPERPVPVLHVHGTDDPCWKYDGGEPDCPTGQRGLAHVSVERTLDEWAAILGCSGEVVEEQLPDEADDGTRTTRLTWQGCAAPLEHLKVEGGGHTWPDGLQYRRERRIGRVERDWGNEVLWAFLGAQAMEGGR